MGRTLSSGQTYEDPGIGLPYRFRDVTMSRCGRNHSPASSYGLMRGGAVTGTHFSRARFTAPDLAFLRHLLGSDEGVQQLAFYPSPQPIQPALLFLACCFLHTIPRGSPS